MYFSMVLLHKHKLNAMKLNAFLQFEKLCQALFKNFEESAMSSSPDDFERTDVLSDDWFS